MIYSPSSCIQQISALINVSLNMLLNISSNINMVWRKSMSNLNRKQKRPCMSLLLKGTLVMGGCDWLTIGVQRNMSYIYLTIITVIFAYSFSLCKRHLQTCLYLEVFSFFIFLSIDFGWNWQRCTSFANALSYNWFY